MNITVWDAIGNGKSLEFIKFYFEGGFVDINARSQIDRQTPLHVAAEKSRNDVLSYLIAKGANVNLKDVLGQTALGEAEHRQNVDAVRLLVEAKASVTIKDASGITVAQRVSHLPIFYEAKNQQMPTAAIQINQIVSTRLKEETAQQSKPGGSLSASFGRLSVSAKEEEKHTVQSENAHKNKLEVVRRLKELLVTASTALSHAEAAAQRAEETAQANKRAVTQANLQLRQAEGRRTRASQAEISARFRNDYTAGFDLVDAQAACQEAADALRVAQAAAQDSSRQVTEARAYVVKAQDIKNVVQKKYDDACAEITPPSSPPQRRASQGSGLKLTVVGTSYQNGRLTSGMVKQPDGTTIYTHYNYDGTSTVRTTRAEESADSDRNSKPVRYLRFNQLLGWKAGQAREVWWDFVEKKWIDLTKVTELTKTYHVIELDVDDKLGRYYYEKKGKRIYVSPPGS